MPRHDSALVAAWCCHGRTPYKKCFGKGDTLMNMRHWLLTGIVASGLAAATAAPAMADWDNHGGYGDHGPGGWHGGPPGGPGWGGDHDHWHGQPYHNWHGHGWWDYDHHWHWYVGWGPAYGYVGPMPVWRPGIPVYAAPPPVYYAPPPPPPPPPPVYYAPPPPPPPVVVAPMPFIVITPGGIGITP